MIAGVPDHTELHQTAVGWKLPGVATIAENLAAVLDAQGFVSLPISSSTGRQPAHFAAR